MVAFVLPIARPSCYDPLDRDRIRREWQQETESYERLMETRRQDYERLKERRRQETESYERLKERRRQEEKGRQRSRLAWINIKGEDGCISYGTRKYSALLSNIPEGYDWMDACMGTPIDIHGVTFRKPDWCGGSVSSCHWRVSTVGDISMLRKVWDGSTVLGLSTSLNRVVSPTGNGSGTR
jgi:hypothetical protein